MTRRRMARKSAQPDTLARYREKRDFELTPEPAGDDTQNTARAKTLRFVVQKHWARRLHYDFRLEIDGTMKSWAVPKGPSLDPSVKRMAVHVEDHPISYNEFEGTIPKGQYGAGKVIIWDRGHWTPAGDDAALAYRAGRLKFELHGGKLRGQWALVRMRSAEGDGRDAWLLMKERDEFARPESEFDVTQDLPGGAPPEMSPQLATRVSAAPRGGDWVYELKYDGYRILGRMAEGHMRLFTRSGHDWTSRLPSLVAALTDASLPDGWYDGEIVVLDAEGRPDFQALQNALESMGPPSRARGASRNSAGYVAGRSGHWIKLKCGERQEFVIGGYTDPKGARSGFGSLLLGYYTEDGRLKYAGNVGSGFSDDTLQTLEKRLRRLKRAEPPFDDPPQSAGIHWVRPRLAAQVAFSQWTASGRVRHAVFQGLREDKKTTAMKKEQPPRITHPDRLVDQRSKTRKADVAVYYQRVAPLIMPYLKDRPVSLLRAPDGIKGELFFQKHLDAERMPGVRMLDPTLDPGHDPLIVVCDAVGLSQLAQLNMIELHTWNATRDRIDRPDQISFDLDPGKEVEWSSMQEAALLLRSFLEELGLPSFVKTSGGKGLHVMVPIIRRYEWDAVKGFARDVVRHMADVLPQRFSAKSGPRNRVGRIFIDYLRNGFGATTVAAWSLRARPGMGISVPLHWEEVETIRGGDHWTIANIDARLETGNAPWADYESAAVALGPAMRRLS